MSRQTEPVPPTSGIRSGRRRARIVPTDEGHGVTTLELFFELVFVFAITQVTAVMAVDLGWRGVLRGLVLLSLLWFVWCSYAWLGNQAHADEGIVRGAVIVAMAAMFVVALAIPEAWRDDGGGINAPVLLAVALAVVRLTHLAVSVAAAATTRDCAGRSSGRRSRSAPRQAGVAAYLIGHLAFRLRNLGSLNRPRTVVAFLLLLAPLAVRPLPALAALAVLAGVLVALIAFEVVRYADARAAVRAEAAHH
ncbi:MAG: low temperature requirement protein [Blastococcus sp.]|nr:low temperature requirement protein [Blastococcus sp.]